MKHTGPRTWRREATPTPAVWVARGKATYLEHSDDPCCLCDQLVDGPALANVDGGGVIHLPAACPYFRAALAHDAGRQR